MRLSVSASLRTVQNGELAGGLEIKAAGSYMVNFAVQVPEAVV